MKIGPWHALSEDVYHDNTGCEAGIAILREDRRKGTAKRELCDVCKALGQVPNFTPPDARGKDQQFVPADLRGRQFDVRAGTPRRARRSGNR